MYYCIKRSFQKRSIPLGGNFYHSRRGDVLRCPKGRGGMYKFAQGAKSLITQKDLGIIISNDLKWNKQVHGTVLKANMMLAFIQRSASDINHIQVCKILYLSLVRSKLGYASQVWAPQTVTNITTMERVQRRATKFILSLPYRSDVLYKDRLQSVGILPICYWLEFLDLVYLYNCVVNDSDTNISIRVSNRRTRNSNSGNGILLNVPNPRLLAFKTVFT